MNKMDEECNIIQSALRNTRTNEGLYISALEQPDDWPTSYDCLGIVRPRITCKDPSIIHKNYQIPCGGKQKRNETGLSEVEEKANKLLAARVRKVWARTWVRRFVNRKILWLLVLTESRTARRS